MKDVKSMTETATTVKQKGVRRQKRQRKKERERKNVGKMKTKYENWMEDENTSELKRSNHQINVPSSDACAPCSILLATFQQLCMYG